MNIHWNSGRAFIFIYINCLVDINVIRCFTQNQIWSNNKKKTKRAKDGISERQKEVHKSKMHFSIES